MSICCIKEYDKSLFVQLFYTGMFPNLPCVFNVDKLREDETLFKVVPLQKFLAKFYAYFS